MYRSCILLVAVLTSTALSLVRAYSVEPKTAAWSGWTPGDPQYNYVSQQVVVSFDSLRYVELFAGERGDSTSYFCAVRLNGTELTVSPGRQDRSQSWVRFEEWSDTIGFVKGKQYTFKFTRGVLGT